MADDPFKLLDDLIRSTNQEKFYYVYYNPITGEITSFRNEIVEDTFPFIEIKSSDIDVSIEEFNMIDYRVWKKDNNLTLIRKPASIEFLSDDSQLIYRVPRQEENKHVSDNPDMVIEQDNDHKLFRICLSESVIEKFQGLELVNQNMSVYVTEEGDPNILYETLTFNISEIISSGSKEIPFGSFSGGVCNIFLTKYFESYLHTEV